MPEDKVTQYYGYLKSKGEKLPDEEVFRSTLSDPEKAEKYYGYLKSKDYDVPETQEAFFSTFNVKKKDDSVQVSAEEGVVSPSVGEEKPPKEPALLKELQEKGVPTEYRKEVEIPDDIFKIEKPAPPEKMKLTPEAEAEFAKIKPTQAEMEAAYKRWQETNKKQKVEIQGFIDEVFPGIKLEIDKHTDFVNDNTQELRRLTVKGNRRDPEEEKRFQELQPLYEEAFNKQNNLHTVADLLTKADKYLKTHDQGIIDGMIKAPMWKDFFTLGLTETLKDFDVLETAKKYQSGEKLTQEESMKLYAYGLNQMIESDYEQALGNMVGSGIIETIPFMVQFALTGPTATTAKEGARRAVAKSLKKMTGNKLKNLIAGGVGKLGGAATRTVMLSDFYEGIAERQIGQIRPEVDKERRVYGVPIEETQLSPLKATAQSFKSTMVTALVEDFGKYGDKAFSYLAKKIKPSPMVNRMTNNTVDQIRDAVGFQSWLSEFGEEVLEAYGQAAVTGDQKLSDVWDKKQMLATLITTGIISGSFSGASHVLKGNTDERMMTINNLKKSEKSLGVKRVNEIDKILKGDDVETNVEQLDTYLKGVVSEGGTSKDVKNILDYVGSRAAVESMNEVESEIQEEVEEKAVVEEKEAIPELEPMERAEAVAEVRKPEEKAEIAEEIVPEEKEVEEVPPEVPEVEKEVVEPKIKEDGKKEMQEKRREEDEGVREEIAREEVREGKREEVLAAKEVVEAVEAKEPKSVKEARDNMKVLEGEKASLAETLKEIPEDQKSKIQEEIQTVEKEIQRQEDYAKEFESRKVREERPEERKIEGVIDKDLSGIYRSKLQDRQKKQEQSVKKIGDIKKKSESQFIEDAESMHELDYLLETDQIKFDKKYQEKKAQLRDEGNLDDVGGRIPMIEAQRAAVVDTKFQEALTKEIGKDRMMELREKKSELLESVSGRLGRIANLKYAVGEGGKKADVVKDLAGVIRDLAELGIVNLELGSRKAIEKLKSYIGQDNPEALKVIDNNAAAIEKELKADIPKKPPRKKAAPKKVEERPAEKREPAEVSKKMIEAEEKALQELKPKKIQETVKLFRKLFVDRAEVLKVALLKEDKDSGRRAIDYFNLQAGVSGKNELEFKRARNKILGQWGKTLSRGEQKALEQYLAMNRIVELDTLYDKRKEERIKHPQGINKEEAQDVIKSMIKNDAKVLENFGLDKLDMEKIIDRADKYYDVMQENLKKLYDEGVINHEAYQKLKDEQPYYSRRQYLEHFIDQADKGGTISGIDALSGGSFGAMLTDMQTLLADNIARTNYAISRTKTIKAMKDYAIENPDSDIIKVAGLTQEYFDAIDKQREKAEEKREYIAPKWEETPNGFTEVDFRDGGQDSRIFIANEFAKDFLETGDPDWLNKTTNLVSWATGNKILKAFATGYNPEFMIKNIPLDMLHILTTTEHYSPIYPVATVQLMNDMRKVLSDVVKRKGRYKDYVNEGGSMDFLTTQGSLTPKKFRKYNKMNQGLRAFADAAAYLGNTSEILTRLALRERVIENSKKDFKKQNDREPNRKELKEIQERATAEARNYLDFAQGGHAVKLLNSAIPYLNAGFQVTRGSLRAAKRNPRVFALKVAQLGATATAITAYNLGMFSGGDDEEKEERKQYYLNDISDREKADNFVIMTPISFKDKNSGKKRYVYFKFPKDNIQKPITGLFEGALMESAGIKKGLINKQRWLELESLFQNFGDLGNMPPLQRAVRGYRLNTDLYYGQPIWSGRDFGKDTYKEYIEGKTPERFIRFGEITGLSPVRSQYFAQQLTTRSNVIGSILGEALDFAAAGVDKEMKQTLDKSAAETLTTAPFSRRFFKSTNPRAKESSAKKAQQKYNVEKQNIENKLRKMVLDKKSEDDIIEWIVNIEDPNESERMMNRYLSGIDKGKIDYRIKELSYIDSKPRANVFYKFLKEADDRGRKELIKQSLQAGGILTRGKFYQELFSLIEQDEELRGLNLIDMIGEQADEVAEERSEKYDEILESIDKAMEEKEEKEE